MSSSRPVKETGWKLTKEIFFGFSIANFTTEPTWSLFTLLTMVTTRTISMPASCMFSMARSFTSKKLPSRPMSVRLIPDAIKRQVGVAHPRLEGLLGKFLAFGEFDAVGGGLHAVVANLARVSDRVQEVRAHRRLAAGELHGHLASRLDP